MFTKALMIPIALLFICVGLRAEDDPLMGTWKLNLEKSTFQPGPPPQSTVRKHESVDKGIKVISDTTTLDGKKSHLEFTAAFDGKFYPITGIAAGAARAQNGISLKRISPYVVEGMNGSEEKPSSRILWTVSKDGKTLTYTIDSIGSDDRAVHNVSVYDRQ